MKGMLPRDARGVAGALAGEVVVDAHAHAGPFFNFHIPWNDGDSIVAEMDRLGIRITCVAPHLAIGPDCEFGNEEAFSLAERSPGRIVCYVVVNPNRPWSLTHQLDRWFKRSEAKGIKLHPQLHRQRADDESYSPVWEYAHERESLVLVHTWAASNECTPKIFEEIARRYPRATILLGHSGGSWQGYKEAVRVARLRENIHLDTTGSFLGRGAIEFLAREIGPERLLFGSDMPFLSAVPQLAKIVYARMSDEAKRAILGRNAVRLLRLET